MTRYYRPRSKADALAVLAEEGSGARPLVGGTDLLVGVRHRTIEPTVIVDLKGIEDLPAPLRIDDDRVLIGPTLTLAELAADPAVREWFPSLAEAALTVGSVAIRNRASLIGNSCNGSPAADTVPAMLVHDVTVTIESVDGARTVPLREFFVGPRRTLCGTGEIVTGIGMNRPPAGYGSAFQRLTRRRGVDLATVSVAAGIDRHGTVVLGLGAVGPRPLRTPLDEPVDPAEGELLKLALERALTAATPISDIRGGREYRTAMLAVLARRAVQAAADRRRHEEVPA
ncbi:xanthine dehydrogenase family protein subunit M [Amycolatopsis endophytica]|uniref:Carbon-monoxide dehydrogenase medium subunit n=1 Tax=Amycolatopsis endophytica TaxID=860233 RepID=A0A853BB68_9PSEU|nr:xanthine dehydrogenase family protein subunit M [Amycolatopsis endophytica]NYI91636.1 carbon-monoxide dehydrogenase medium subunit [Amycolatopsis endophytica]